METRMNVCTQAEADFFLSHIKPHHKVLEYGSGGSTLEIAGKAASVVSIEHHLGWFEKTKSHAPGNVTILFHPPVSEPENGADGTKEQFLDYVEAPLKIVQEKGPFDIIFIDGRARVSCAELCEKLGHPGTLVFIHDYNHPDPQYLRMEYFDAEKYLLRIEGELTMWKFLIRAFIPEPSVEREADIPSHKTPLSESDPVKKKASSKGYSGSKAHPKGSEKRKPVKTDPEKSK